MIIDIDNLTKSFGAKTVLSGLTLKIEDQDRIGLIGENGAGKSTLLNIIIGDLDYDSGTVSRGTDKRIGFLRQDSGLLSDGTIESEMYRVFAVPLAEERRMTELGERMSQLPHDSEEYRRAAADYEASKSAFEAADGYNIPVFINTVLDGMGFSGFDRGTTVATMSGGERTRLALAKLLLERPDLLMLDEPTNHLDFKTLEWLEGYLSSYKGAILTVSHDRYFLDKIVTAVCELENRTIVRYNAGYTKYVDLKDARIARMQKEYDRQMREIESMEDFIAKNKVRASTTNRARSREAALERMEMVERPVPPPKPPKFTFTYEREPVKDVLTIEDLKLEAGSGDDKKLLCPSVSLEMKRGEKVALVGANGVGKSTLLKTLLGLLPYEHGRIIWGRNVKTGYYDQHNEGLHPEKTMLEEMWDMFPRSDEQTLRSALGHVRLVGDNVFKKIAVLSGGERARLSFAALTMRDSNFLLLDEPTNHMDIQCKEALDKALREYTGTILMVSHDRYLLNRVPDRIIEMFPDGLISYKGGYDEYLAQRAQDGAGEKPHREKKEEPEEPRPRSEGGHRSRDQRRSEAERKRRISEVEAGIMEAERRIFQIQEQMADPEVCADYLKMSELCSELEEVKADHGALMDEWAALGDEEDE